MTDFHTNNCFRPEIARSKVAVIAYLGNYDSKRFSVSSFQTSYPSSRYTNPIKAEPYDRTTSKMEDPNRSCVICNNNIVEDEDFCVIREKGANGINKASREKDDDLVVEAGATVHVVCRKNYLKRGSAKSNSDTTYRRGTRLSTGGFNFRKDCFLCGLTVTEWEINSNKTSNVSCKYREVDISVYKAIQERGSDDDWAIEVRGRLEVINDLRSEDSIYHNSCDTKFRMGCPKTPKSGSSNTRKRRRPVDISREAAFVEITNYLEENDDGQITLSECTVICKLYMLPSNHASFRFFPYRKFGSLNSIHKCPMILLD